MSIRLDYGKRGLEIDLPDYVDVQIIESKYHVGFRDPVAAIRSALQSPIGSPPLREIVQSRDTVGIVFYDITRPTPDHIMIPLLIEELEAAGVFSQRHVG